MGNPTKVILQGIPILLPASTLSRIETNLGTGHKIISYSLKPTTTAPKLPASINFKSAGSFYEKKGHVSFTVASTGHFLSDVLNIRTPTEVSTEVVARIFNGSLLPVTLLLNVLLEVLK